MFKINVLSAERPAVVFQLHIVHIGVCPDGYLLTDVEIPVRHDMHERFRLLTDPYRFIEIVRVLRETGGIDYAEVGIFRAVGSGFTDIVKSRPYELSSAVFPVAVIYQRFLA